jgi:hypothetical protein
MSYKITAAGERILITQEEHDIANAIQVAEDAARVLPSIIGKRKSRYHHESDPLFHEWQYTGVPSDETKWRDQVALIKSELPLPV